VIYSSFENPEFGKVITVKGEQCYAACTWGHRVFVLTDHPNILHRGVRYFMYVTKHWEYAYCSEDGNWFDQPRRFDDPKKFYDLLA
jgi:hypothetical protein